MQLLTLKIVIAWLYLLAGVLAAAPLTPAQICAKSCYVAVSSLNFTSSPPTHGPNVPPPSAYLCSSFLPVSSIFACFRMFCSYPPTRINFRQLNDTCKWHLADYVSTMANVELRQLPRAKPDESNKVFNSTVLPSEEKVSTLFHSFVCQSCHNALIFGIIHSGIPLTNFMPGHIIVDNTTYATFE